MSIISTRIAQIAAENTTIERAGRDFSASYATQTAPLSGVAPVPVVGQAGAGGTLSRRKRRRFGMRFADFN